MCTNLLKFIQPVCFHLGLHADNTNMNKEAIPPWVTWEVGYVYDCDNLVPTINSYQGNAIIIESIRSLPHQARDTYIQFLEYPRRLSIHDFICL